MPNTISGTSSARTLSPEANTASPTVITTRARSMAKPPQIVQQLAFVVPHVDAAQHEQRDEHAATRPANRRSAGRGRNCARNALVFECQQADVLLASAACRPWPAASPGEIVMNLSSTAAMALSLAAWFRPCSSASVVGQAAAQPGEYPLGTSGESSRSASAFFSQSASPISTSLTLTTCGRSGLPFGSTTISCWLPSLCSWGSFSISPCCSAGAMASATARSSFESDSGVASAS